MSNTTLETVQIETLAQVTGGEMAGFAGMLSNAFGGSGRGGKGLGEMLGGGGGDERGVAGRVAGFASGLFSGNKPGGVVEGK